ncbi:CidA/LrgA family protein [Oceanobacillus sp. J11TS1]|uniref:CidA/LrgA family protein n=1 Tax=Oceanobacillus sp. J11TS1 TaxID=2807191 RepID=UPI001B0C53E7|nr:CidA/LrgA family holin-like protein [Oceanobacillus sp. J11TS1]GIO22234.1 holin-like protein CidA [Oceanobacillus sp. J11TS1]
MKIIKVILQICFLHVFLILGAVLKYFIPLPIPASMFGLFVLFVALCCNVIKLEWVDQGAKWLMAELLLFFIPSAVGIINYQEIFSLQGLAIVFLIVISTMIVMGITALTAEKISAKKKGESH